jgi:hypothetical protein
MTGFGKDTLFSFRKKSKTVVWQTHVIIPANATHLADGNGTRSQ